MWPPSLMTTYHFGTFGLNAIGDVDGDGVGDIVLTDNNAAFSMGPTGTGCAFLYSGKRGVLLHTLRSPNEMQNGLFGVSSAAVPDVDGDGIQDVVIGAAFETSGTSPQGAGRVHIFSGNTGLALRTLMSPNEEQSGQFGFSVSSIEDVDGDGKGDVIIGAPYEDRGVEPLNRGYAYVISGGTGNCIQTLVSANPANGGFFGCSVSGVPEIDDDVAWDLVVGTRLSQADPHAYAFSGLNGNHAKSFTFANRPSNTSIDARVVVIPDINGDAVYDLLVGDANWNAQAGQALIISGLDGSLLNTLVSPNQQSGGYFGCSVSAIADINGDGIPDIIAGAESEAPGSSPASAGRAYVFSGQTGELLKTLVSPAEKTGGNFGISVAAIDDINEDGLDEVAVGTATEDRVYVFPMQPVGTGNLTVTISPPEAVSSGAQWSVDGGASWNDSGVTISDIDAGIATLIFKSISGWTTPTDQSVVILTNQTTSTSGTYSKIQYSLDTSVVGGHGTLIPESGMQTANDIVSLTATPEDGYQVKEWVGTDNDSLDTNTNTVTMASDKVVTVEFEPITYLLTTSVIGGHGALAPLTGLQNANSVVQLSAVPEDGYKVAAWTGTDNDSLTTSSNTVTMTSPKSVTVAFQLIPIIEYTLSLLKIGNGQITIDGVLHSLPWSGNFAAGTNVTLEAISDANWQFDAWQDGFTGSDNPISFTMNENKTITVVFSQGEGEGEGEGEAIPDIHSADTSGDNKIQLQELLRVIQFFNMGGYSCDTTGSTADGYAPGPGASQSCVRHATDYDTPPWKISLQELLRLIQFFNIGGYHACPGEETADGYCPGSM